MGALISADDWTGRTVNGVTLGEPVQLPDGRYMWDGAVPDGTIDPDGAISSLDRDLQPVKVADVSEWQPTVRSRVEPVALTRSELRAGRTTSGYLTDLGGTRGDL